jgi:hypothetical protein
MSIGRRRRSGFVKSQRSDFVLLFPLGASRCFDVNLFLVWYLLLTVPFLSLQVTAMMHSFVLSKA